MALWFAVDQHLIRFQSAVSGDGAIAHPLRRLDRFGEVNYAVGHGDPR